MALRRGGQRDIGPPPGSAFGVGFLETPAALRILMPTIRGISPP